MTEVNPWIAGMRLRTLPAAAVPVMVGTAAAAQAGEWHRDISFVKAALALFVALALQVGTNFANDYSDGIRGTDDETRVGPMRLVGSGLVEPGKVKTAAMLAFGVAAVLGLVLAIMVGFELLIVGAASILAGWFYTGGSNPYGYLGLGEVFVFVFFGLVATIGSAYVQIEQITGVASLAAVGVGFLAVALLVTNNLRDREADGEVGKNTLAVRMGDRPTRLLFAALLIGAFAFALFLVPSRRWAFLALAAAPLAIPPLKAVLDGARGGALIAVLGSTGKLQMAYGLLLSIGLWISV